MDYGKPQVGLFTPDSPSAVVLLNWFRQLESDSGARARLRRCDAPDDVVLEPAFHRLASRLDDARPTQLGPIVWLLAHVRTVDESASLGRLLQQKLSEDRFRRLLESSDRAELANKLRAAIAVCRGRTNILDVARTVYWWGDRERRRLATEFYGGQE